MSSRAVLEWLASMLEWASHDPGQRLQELLAEVSKHQDRICRALLDAAEEEFKGYILEVVGLAGINCRGEDKAAGEEVQRAARGEEEGTGKEVP